MISQFEVRFIEIVRDHGVAVHPKHLRLRHLWEAVDVVQIPFLAVRLNRFIDASSEKTCTTPPKCPASRKSAMMMSAVRMSLSSLMRPP